MWSSLNKHFTSDAMQSSGNVVKKFLEIKAKNFLISGFKRFLVSISWRYMIIVCFWVLTSPNMIQLCWNYCQRWYSSKQKHCFKYFWRIWVFIETRRTQNLHFWSTLDVPPPPVPLSPRFYLIAIGLSRDIKINQCSISSPCSGKNTITFCTSWAFFGKKQGGVTDQSVRTKIWHMLFHSQNCWSTSCKKILVLILSSFEAAGHFRKMIAQILKFGCISW